MSDLRNARGGGKDDAGFGGMDAAADGDPRSCEGDREGFDMDAWWEDRSLPQKILAGIGFGILGIGLLALLGVVVMLLWNWLMPEIFGLKRLGYWQAWGLLVLCWILFKSWGFGNDNSSVERKRKRQLRRYMQEDQSPAGEEAVGSPEA